MDWNKIPRWALILVALVGLGATNLVISTARADLDRFKTIAYQAKNISDANTASIAELKASVDGIKNGQETFRKEYREDTKEFQKTLAEISKAVKA